MRVLADVVGANVRVDGLAAGVTPLPARALPYGDHLIEVEWQGIAARRTITIDGNSAAVLRYLSKEKRWEWE